MKLFRSIHEPIREDRSWEERWKGPDRGLIACWERGREMRRENPDLAVKATAGQLVVLPWKGGAETATKKGQKFCAYYYLAMWQGLRAENLNIETSEERSIVCTVTGMTVVFTNDATKYSEA